VKGGYVERELQLVQTVVCFVFSVEIPLYCLGVIAVINTIGYVIYRGSNLQKSEFRRNPLNPALARE
jgi:hypothetical protein